MYFEGEEPAYQINIYILTNKSVSIYWRNGRAAPAFLDRQDGPNISKYFLRSNKKHRHALLETPIQGKIFEDDAYFLFKGNK